jgi:hypothetical protein
MGTNPFFNKKPHTSSSVLEDLTVETIRMYGRDMVYLPRTLVREDTIFGEDNASIFSDGMQMEMYIDSIDGFGGGDQITQFGFEIQDSVDLVVAKRVFRDNFVGSGSTQIHPQEGDLIYFPMSRYIFEIKFVEHENPFYQLGKLYTYRLSCELFRYSHEKLDTGWSAVDGLEDAIDGVTGASGDIIPQDGYGTNSNIKTEGDSILDFSENDPFSEGNY